jgi:hypothetical protein
MGQNGHPFAFGNGALDNVRENNGLAAAGRKLVENRAATLCIFTAKSFDIRNLVIAQNQGS